jgi:hypothetical protein
MDRVEKIFLIMYKDEGVAGGVLTADSSEGEIALLQKASEKFGRNKVHIGERLYDNETWSAIYDEIHEEVELPSGITNERSISSLKN